ncbi:MAG: hypothetical protein ACM3SV_05280 [Betaproteobacteria bacterium]
MRVIPLFLALLVPACGVADVGTAAATNAKLSAEQARQGKEAADKVKRDLEAAAQDSQRRMEEAERKSGG